MESLLNLSEPLPKIRKQLSEFPWDSPKEEAVLTADRLSSILQRHIAGRLSAVELEDWANLIEGRDDIGLPGGNEGTIVKDVIFELANPSITRQLNPRRADELLGMLRTSPTKQQQGR